MDKSNDEQDERQIAEDFRRQLQERALKGRSRPANAELMRWLDDRESDRRTSHCHTPSHPRYQPRIVADFQSSLENGNSNQSARRGGGCLLVEFPFVMHIAGDSCLDSETSPSAKLNASYEALARDVDPVLHGLLLQVRTPCATLRLASDDNMNDKVSNQIDQLDRIAYPLIRRK